jgi:DNA polymerase elongation subunit (family B)
MITNKTLEVFMKETTVEALEKAVQQTLNRIAENGATQQDNEFLSIANTIMPKPKENNTNKMMEQILPQLMQKLNTGNGTPPMNNLGGM